MKNILVSYSVHISTKFVAANIENNTAGHFTLTRASSYGDTPTYFYKPKEYKSLAAAVRASRRWVHDMLGAEIEEAET